MILKSNSVIMARAGSWSNNMIWATVFNGEHGVWSKTNTVSMAWSRQWGMRMSRTWTFRGGR